MSGLQHSKTVQERIASPQFRGAFDLEDARDRGLALNTVKVRSVTLNALFDAETQVLYDARFFSYVPILVAITDVFLELARGLPLDRLNEVTPERIELALRDDPDTPAVHESRLMYFEEVKQLVEALAENMPSAIALAHASETARSGGLNATSALEQRMHEFQALPEFAQRVQIEEVLDRHIRPGLAVDGGNITLTAIEDGRQLTLTYEGNCGSCGISAGATLAFIERTLRREIHDQLEISTPNASTAWMEGPESGITSPFAGSTPPPSPEPDSALPRAGKGTQR